MRNGGVSLQVSMLKKSTHDLFSCPGFMLHTFEAQLPVDDAPHLPPQEPPTTSGATHPDHGLGLAKIAEVYNALLQVQA